MLHPAHVLIYTLCSTLFLLAWVMPSPMGRTPHHPSLCSSLVSVPIYNTRMHPLGTFHYRPYRSTLLLLENTALHTCTYGNNCDHMIKIHRTMHTQTHITILLYVIVIWPRFFVATLKLVSLLLPAVYSVGF